MSPRKLKSILAAMLLIASTITPMLITPVAAVHQQDWYRTIDGVLASDTYDFYPYENKGVSVGFSKFGENVNWDPDQNLGVGIQYPGYESVGTYDQEDDTSRDPFANEYIDKELQINGWLMEVRYTFRGRGDRRVLTGALFADLSKSGEPWLVGHDPDFDLAPHGGRKTTGYAESENITVLYDGPRKYIAETTTHIYDWFDTDEDGVLNQTTDTIVPIVDLKITFIFNKVKKELILLKDIKQVISGKELDSPLDIQFGEREEWDMGPPDNFWSFAHFWHQEKETCFGPDWHMSPGIMREFKTEHQVTATSESYTFYLKWPEGDYGLPIVDGSERLYLYDPVEDEYNWLDPGTDYTLTRSTGLVEMNIPLEENDIIRTIFKVWKYYDERGDVFSDQAPTLGTWDAGDIGGPDSGVPHLYDVVQVISEDKKYVGCKAYWPTLSDWTSDGWNLWDEPLNWVEQEDITPDEPEIPFTIGEWDFMLGKGFPSQFRGVEVVAFTEYHDALDDEMAGVGVNMMDRELQYQLDEVFNPWDLQKAVHKPTKTWVEWKQATPSTTYTTNHRPFAEWSDNEWDQYNDDMGNKVFSERVWDLTTGELLNRWEGDYDVYRDVNGYGYFYNLPANHKLKIMYHTMPRISEEWFVTSTNSLNETDWNWSCNTTTFDPSDPTWNWEDNLGAYHSGSLMTPAFEVHLEENTTDWSDTWTDSWTWEEDNFKVYREETMESSHDFSEPYNITLMDGESEVAHIWNFQLGEIMKSVTASMDLDVTWPIDGETLHVKNLDHTVTVTIEADYNHTEDRLVLDVTYNVDVTYNEMLGGRWEHTVVGKDAASVDSIGAALVTAAFKNKQVEIGISGIDMMDPELANSAPWVMRKFGDGDMLTDYHMDHAGGDHRAAVKDDWCHTWQISGANLIAVGGPGANVLAYYGNDFAEAIYGHPLATSNVDMFDPQDSPWMGRIAASTGWNKNTYSSFDNETFGYAVISTYHDINGTTLLSIWGHFGRDTYYASRFFHEELIYEFQDFDECITSVILEIDYTDPDHPTFDIVEVLGPISEHAEWTETWEARAFLHGNSPDYDYQYPSGLSSAWTITKGGIHDP